MSGRMWSDLDKAQKEVRAHGRSLARVFNLGADKGKRNKSRCYNNVSSWAMDPPILRAQAKTHKQVEGDGMPKSRPVCDVSQSYGTPLGDLISDLITPIHRCNANQKEVQSTEEMLKFSRKVW